MTATSSAIVTWDSRWATTRAVRPPDSLSCGTVKSRGTGAAGLRRRLIKDDDGRVCQQCARQGDLLRLGR